MRHFQGGIPHFSCLLTENRPKQPLLRSQFRLAFRRHFADQNITGTHLRTDTDDTVAVQIFQRIIAHARHVLCDTFRAQLCIAGFRLILFYMNGCIDILSHKPLTDQYRILIVIPFPGHKADQRILTERQFAKRRGRTVGNNFSGFYMVALFHDRLLVITVGLVTSHKLGQMVLVLLPVITDHLNDPGRHIGNRTAFSRNHTNARVHSRLLLHTCTDRRSLREQKRYRLTLHVGTHQRAVGIIVLQERDQRRRHREYHLGRHVHIVHHSLRIVLCLLLITGGYTFTHKISVVIQRCGCLCNIIVILFIGRHINNLIRYLRILRIALINLTVGSFHKTILVDPRIAGEGVDQSDVRSFRCLYRTHPPVMCIMYITHLKPGTVSGKSAGPQCG